MYEVILPNGDRAEAPTLDAIIFASRTLINEASAAGYASSILRRDVIVTYFGIYNGAATMMARKGWVS